MLKFEAIGTHWQIDIYDEISAEKEAEILKCIRDRIEIFDKDYSRFRDDSLVMEMAKTPGKYPLPAHAPDMMNLYYKLYALTGSAFTPLIGQTLVDAGYDAKYTLEEKVIGEIAKPMNWSEALNYDTEKNILEIKKPVLLDFGGIGKGYLIDIIGQILLDNEILSFCIDAGGDILHVTRDDSQAEIPPLRVGLEHPENTSQVIGVIEIKNKSICGSSGNRRAWKNFHHIMDPHTGEASRKILASWVTADTTIVADALATCLFFVPPNVLEEGGFQFEYLVLHPDYSVEKSAGFDAELFTK